jgi:pimeloyl-[acyl-carrier protein] methyl ester esterase
VTEKNPHTIEVIAMHGWAGDARCWEPWKRATKASGWQWETGERGYGEFTPRPPQWSNGAEVGTQRVVLGHSLGPHLLPPETLRDADAIVLLASFANFVPPGPAGRRARAALSGMAACLGEEGRARTMLTNFMMKVAEPQSLDRLPPGPLDGALDETNLARLRADLDLLARCDGLPDGFPSGARVLIVEAEEDRIVEPAARALLREALPEAEVLALPGVGHALLAGDVIGRVVAWVEAKRAK